MNNVSMYANTSTTTDSHEFQITANIIIILSNITFLLPCISCLYKTKYFQAYVYASVFFVSSLYHTCKFGFENRAGDDGLCLFLTFDDYFKLDHFFAIMTIPIMAMYLTCFDVIIVTCGNETPNKGGKFVVYNVNSRLDSNQLATYGTLELKEKVFKFDDHRCFMKHLNRSMREIDARLDYTDAYKSNDVVVDVNSQKSDEFPRYRKEGLRNEDMCFKRAIVGSSEGNSEVTSFLKIKCDYSDEERLLLCIFATVLAVSLKISGPSTVLIVCVILSTLFITIIMNAYFYVKYNIHPNFEGRFVYVSFLYCLIAVALMGTQDYFPGTTYWIIHSIWHVTASLGQWYLLEAKKRFYLMYRYYKSVSMDD